MLCAVSIATFTVIRNYTTSSVEVEEEVVYDTGVAASLGGTALLGTKDKSSTYGATGSTAPAGTLDIGQGRGQGRGADVPSSSSSSSVYSRSLYSRSGSTSRARGMGTGTGGVAAGGVSSRARASGGNLPHTAPAPVSAQVRPRARSSDPRSRQSDTHTDRGISARRDIEDRYSTTSSRMTPKTPGEGAVSTLVAGTKSVRSAVEPAQRVTVKGGHKGQKSVLRIVGGEDPALSGVSGRASSASPAPASNNIVSIIAVRESSVNGLIDLLSVIVLTTNGKALRINVQSSDRNYGSLGNGTGGGYRPQGGAGSRSATTLFHFHTGPVWGLATGGDRDGDGDEDGRARGRETGSGCGGQLIVTGGDDRWLCVWSATRRALVVRARTVRPIRCCALDSTGRFLAVGHTLGAISVYGIANSEADGLGSGRDFWGTRDLVGRREHRDRDGDGDRGRGRSKEGVKRAVPCYTLTLLCEAKKLQEDVSDIKFSPNNKMLAVGSHDNYIDM